MNDNKERLFDFCATNNWVIRATVFPHKLPRRSPDGKISQQAEHEIINAKRPRALPDSRVCRRVDLFGGPPRIFCRVILDRINNAHCQQTPLSIRLGSVGARSRYLLLATSTEWDVALFVSCSSTLRQHFTLLSLKQLWRILHGVWNPSLRT